MSEPNYERMLLERIESEVSALRESNVDMHHVSGAHGAKLDAMNQKLDAFIAGINDGHAKHGARLAKLEAWRTRAVAVVTTVIAAIQTFQWWLTHRGE